MKRYLRLLAMLAALCSQHAFAQKGQLLKTTGGAGMFHWTSRSIACNTKCITGNCDKGNVCTDPEPFKTAYRKAIIENAVTIKNRSLYLKEGYKKYFTGNNSDCRGLQLLEDDNDRVMIYAVGKPEILTPGSKFPDQPVLKVNAKPLTLKSISVAGDVLLCKLPKNFPDTFEIGIETVKYCNKLVCGIWTPYNRMHMLKKEMAAQTYPVMPLLIDTITSEVPAPYAIRKNVTLKVPFPKDKNGFTVKEVMTIIDALNEPPFIIKNIDISVNASMEGDSLQNIIRQKQLGEGFVRTLSMLPMGNGLRSKVRVNDAWSAFKKTVVLSNYFYLADSSERVIRKKLVTDKWLIRNVAPILQELSMATIVLDIEFDPKAYPETEYWHYKLSHAVIKNDAKLALSYQKELMRLHRAGKIKTERLVTVNMPENPYYLSLLNNQCAYMTSLAEQKERLQKLIKVDPNNPLLKYNLFAINMNEIRMHSEDTLRDEMAGLTTVYNTVNAASVPKSLYQILQARFYMLMNENKKDRKLQTYESIKPMVKSIPANEAIMIADDYARIRRFDIATPILLEHSDKITAQDTTLAIQYALRILFYGKYAGPEFENNTAIYKSALATLYTKDKKLFCRLFDTHHLSYMFMTDPEVRKMYTAAKGGSADAAAW